LLVKPGNCTTDRTSSLAATTRWSFTSSLVVELVVAVGGGAVASRGAAYDGFGCDDWGAAFDLVAS